MPCPVFAASHLAEAESKWILKYIGGKKLSSVTIATINCWMSAMAKDGYAARSCASCLTPS